MSHTLADGSAVVVDDHDGAPEAQTIGVVPTLIRIAGIVGGAVLASVAIGWIFGLSVLVFATGSMAPTMPAGTAAIVERIDASAVKIGDVVTVPRPGQTLPVTHRVVSVSTVDGDTSARSLVLRGDANDANDREPYVVEEVERVLVAVPGAGRVIGAAQSPFGVGLAAAVVVMGLLWSFWPAQRRDEREAAAAADDADADVDALKGSDE